MEWKGSDVWKPLLYLSLQWVYTAVALNLTKYSIATVMLKNESKVGVKKRRASIQRRNPTITVCSSTMWNHDTHMTTGVCMLLPLIGGNDIDGRHNMWLFP